MQSEGAKRPLLCGREGGDSVPPLLYVVVPRQLKRVVLGTHRRGKMQPCSLNVRNVPCFVAGREEGMVTSSHKSETLTL